MALSEAEVILYIHSLPVPCKWEKRITNSVSSQCAQQIPKNLIEKPHSDNQSLFHRSHKVVERCYLTSAAHILE